MPVIAPFCPACSLFHIIGWGECVRTRLLEADQEYVRLMMGWDLSLSGALTPDGKMQFTWNLPESGKENR